MTTKAKEQDAATELEQAEQGVEEVLERIKDLDPKVKPGDLEAAEGRVRFAQARLEGEERRREEEAERERLRRFEEIKKQASAELDLSAIEDLKKAAAEALDAYVGAVVAREARLDELAQELARAGSSLPNDLRMDARSSGLYVTVDGRDIPRKRPASEVSRIAYDALRRHIPYGAIDFDRFYSDVHKD
jgi:chromosome segregation ATPase